MANPVITVTASRLFLRNSKMITKARMLMTAITYKGLNKIEVKKSTMNSALMIKKYGDRPSRYKTNIKE